jgi:hypothetical protein
LRPRRIDEQPRRHRRLPDRKAPGLGEAEGVDPLHREAHLMAAALQGIGDLRQPHGMAAIAAQLPAEEEMGQA